MSMTLAQQFCRDVAEHCATSGDVGRPASVLRAEHPQVAFCHSAPRCLPWHEGASWHTALHLRMLAVQIQLMTAVSIGSVQWHCVDVQPQTAVQSAIIQSFQIHSQIIDAMVLSSPGGARTVGSSDGASARAVVVPTGRKRRGAKGVRQVGAHARAGGALLAEVPELLAVQH